MRPTIDSRTAAAVGGCGFEDESGPAITHERLDALLADLGVDGDRPLLGGELRGVGQRLAGSPDDRPHPVVGLAVADRDDLDLHAIGVLDLLRRRPQGRREPRCTGAR